MAKDKVTITLDRAKADRARSLVNAGSTSEVIDLALDRLIRAARISRDVEAYRRRPPVEDEFELAQLPPDDLRYSALDDDTDWEQLYALDDQ